MDPLPIPGYSFVGEYTVENICDGIFDQVIAGDETTVNDVNTIIAGVAASGSLAVHAGYIAVGALGQTGLVVIGAVTGIPVAGCTVNDVVEDLSNRTCVSGVHLYIDTGIEVDVPILTMGGTPYVSVASGTREVSATIHPSEVIQGLNSVLVVRFVRL